jgi:hypothetical protein
MEYIFELSEYNRDELEAQACAAVEKRVELSSRRVLPRVWKAVDRLSTRKAPEPILRRRAARYKIYGFALLAFGIFLLIPGLMEPKELFVPLIMGTVCTLLGVLYLLPRRKQPSRKIREGAAQLISGAQTAARRGNAPVMIRFSQDGMMLPGGEAVTYDSFDAIVETASVYLLTWNGKRAILLQKRDLAEASQEDFLRFFEEKTELKPVRANLCGKE